MFTVRDFDAHTIRWWYGRRNEIDMSPPYQRKGRLWSVADKQLLIDSLLNEYDIPKFYFADFTIKNSVELNPTGKQFAVIDGKQRLEAIIDFIEGRLPLAKDFVLLKDPSLKLGGLVYADLVKSYPGVGEILDDYILDVITIITDEVGLINDQFIRLNRSKPLSGAELRNAFVGVVPSAVRRVLEHKFFKQCIKFPDSRGQDNNLASKLLLMEFTGRPTETKKTNLEAFAKLAVESGSDQIEPAEASTIRNLDVLAGIFAEKDALLAQAGPVPAYYWFIRGLDLSLYRWVRGFLVEFEKERERVRKSMRTLASPSDEPLPVPSEDMPYVVYNTILRSVDDASSIRTRAIILTQLFDDWLGLRMP